MTSGQQDNDRWKSLVADIQSLPQDSSLVDRLIDAGYYRYNFFGDSVFYYADQAIALASKISYNKGLVSANNLKGSYSNSQNRHQDAIDYFQEAIRVNKLEKNPVREAQLMGNLANVLSKLGEDDSAISIKLSNLDVFKQHNDSAAIEACLGSIGWLFERKKNYQKAKLYFLASLAYNQSVRNKAYTYGNIGIALKNLGQIDSALIYYKLAADTYPDHLQFNGDNYSNIAQLYLQQNQWDSCEHYFLRAERNFQQLADTIHLAHLDVSWADSYLRQGLHDKARTKIEASRQMILTRGTTRNKQRFLKIASDVYAQVGQPERSNAFLRSLIRLQDSLNLVEMNARVAEIETRYQTLEKEKKILDQTMAIRQQERRQSRLIATILAVALLAGMVIYVMGQRAHFRKVKMEQDLELRELRISELEKTNQINTLHATLMGEETERKRIASDLHDGLGALLATIKLHFRNVHNGLHAAQALQPFQKAADLLDEASVEVRRIAHNMMPAALIEFGLVSSIEDQIVDMRSYGYDVIWKKHGQIQRIDPEREMMLYRVIQELLQNIHKHAGADTIQMTYTQSEDTIELMIADDGKGFDPERIERGLGLKSIHSRVEFLAGSFVMESTPSIGTTTRISIPVSLVENN